MKGASLIAISILSALLTIFTFVATTQSGHASAYKCAPPQNPGEALKDAAAVFTGKTINVKRVDVGTDDERGIVEIEVEKVWKGKIGQTAFVSTFWRKSGESWYEFTQGKRYLIYAHQISVSHKAEKLIVSMCTRTKPLDLRASADLKELGEGKDPE